MRAPRASLEIGFLREVSAASKAEAYRFCAEAPERTVYIAGWLGEGGLDRSPLLPRARLFGEIIDGRISGLAYLSSTGILMPIVKTSRALEDLTEMARRNPSAIRVVVGERRQVGELWSRLEALGLRARLIRDQLGYSVSRTEYFSERDSLELERATQLHLDQVVAASAAMAREEAHDDPQQRNPELFRHRISERLTRGRDFVHLVNGQLVFKCNVAAISPLGGQIEGIYTVPHHRRNRIGQRGTAAVTAWVLERAERAVLLVNEDNRPARLLYEALGYRSVLESRTIFVV